MWYHPLLFGDFFSDILTFLRQLPFTGQFLNLSFIRPVCHHPAIYSIHLSLTRTTASRPPLSKSTYACRETDTTNIPLSGPVRQHTDTGC